MSDRAFKLCLLGIGAVVLLGIDLDVMEVDAAQYAGMSRDMLKRGDLLKLYFRDADYLDKPPLLFWLSALSFTCFGVHDWSYRLPSVLFAFLALFSTHRFTALYHGQALARTATLVLGGSAAFFLMTNDVRCDTILTGSVITAIWLGCAWLETGKGWPLIGCAVATGAGLLAKGPMGAVAPLIAVGGQLLLTRNWSRLRDPQLLLGVVVVGAMLLPMCIGLYEQHGGHGLRFYFWEQSFGRITGENRWRDDSTVLFFTHEVLWQLLPWTLFLMVGIWRSLVAMVRGHGLPEYASVSGALLLFVALSLSQFKLPHYLYVIAPLFAVLGAIGMHGRMTKALARTQIMLLYLMLLIAVLLTWITFPEGRWPFLAMLVATGIAVGVSIARRKAVGQLEQALVPASFWVMVAVGLVMNGHFYPHLLHYQANARAGQWAYEQGLTKGAFYGMQVSGSALDYYAGYPVPWISNVTEARAVIAPGVVIYTDGPHRDDLLAAGLRPQHEVVLQNYPAQRLALPFLFPERRSALLEQRYLLEF